jgi:hypothetical protein
MALSLKDIKNKLQEQEERNSRPDIEWFSLKGKKTPIFIQFLQELDEESPKYDSSRGKALFLLEHVSPFDFKRRGECSLEAEGQCFACEKNKDEPFLKIGGEDIKYPWAQKTNIYIYVIDDDGVIKVLSRGAYSSFVNKMIDYVGDEGEGALTGNTFKITKGPTKNSAWELSTTKQKLEIPSDIELPDLSAGVGRKIKYDEQKRFYMVNQEPVTEVAEPKVSQDADW